MKTLLVILALFTAATVQAEDSLSIYRTVPVPGIINNRIWNAQSDTCQSFQFYNGFEYRLERVAIDTVQQCDTLFVPDGVKTELINELWETTTYAHVEIHCKRVPQERIVWYLKVDREIAASELPPGWRITKKPVQKTYWGILEDAILDATLAPSVIDYLEAHGDSIR